MVIASGKSLVVFGLLNEVFSNRWPAVKQMSVLEGKHVFVRVKDSRAALLNNLGVYRSPVQSN